MTDAAQGPVLFVLQRHAIAGGLARHIAAQAGQFETRQFPDGETYLQVATTVERRDCVVLADLSRPNDKYLPLIFLLETLRDLGAASVGLVAPYLCYMRQDNRFTEGEAVTSRVFAADLCRHIDWLVTVDPHLHRYRSLDEIYTSCNRAVSSAPALSAWLGKKSGLLLVGPDAESEQWVAGIAADSGRPFVVGSKQRRGDRDVLVTLPDLGEFRGHTAVIVDDVIASGGTLLQCIDALRRGGIERISCLAVHGIFEAGADRRLLAAGLEQLITTNTVPHPSNAVDVSGLIAPAVIDCIGRSEANKT